MANTTGKKWGGRQKGTLNKANSEAAERMDQLGFDPAEALCMVALRRVPCGTCIDENREPTGRTRCKLPEGKHAAGCEQAHSGRCTCEGIGDRVCESCFGTLWERIAVPDLVKASSELMKYKYPQLKAIEVSGSLDVGARNIAQAITEARKKRMKESG